MSDITYQRVSEDEFRIFQDDRYAGDVLLHENVLRPGTFVFIIHLESDPRGPSRVTDRKQVRREVRRLIESHPLF